MGQKFVLPREAFNELFGDHELMLGHGFSNFEFVESNKC